MRSRAAAVRRWSTAIRLRQQRDVVGNWPVVGKARRMLQKMTSVYDAPPAGTSRSSLRRSTRASAAAAMTVFEKLHQGTSGCGSGSLVASAVMIPITPDPLRSL
jgi:hypothetical protein